MELLVVEREREERERERAREGGREGGREEKRETKKANGSKKNFQCSILSQEAVRWSRRKWRCGACAATTRTPPLWG